MSRSRSGKWRLGQEEMLGCTNVRRTDGSLKVVDIKRIPPQQFMRTSKEEHEIYDNGYYNITIHKD